ncbi:MAG TPA: hypothetical protein VGQ52_13740 [Gemmatimonadaceae bacterium]|jgi:hypothetical protein|nr:hypothetical protein [Gemmatimonadaceae bacterium]
MKVGIVGHEAAKFTPQTEATARRFIRGYLKGGARDLNLAVVSGACHLGGIDIWAIEEARALGLPTVQHPPEKRQWEGGYKQRNILIAEDSDVVLSIVVRELPATYTGMRFEFCYHCRTKSHVKSGGCWTAKYAQRLGKRGTIIIIHGDDWSIETLGLNRGYS